MAECNEGRQELLGERRRNGMRYSVRERSVVNKRGTHRLW